jgi:hypothetical protein
MSASRARVSEPRALNAGGGGDNWDEVDARIAILMERIAHLPSKGFFVTTNMTGVAFLSGVILFGEKLKALIGV